MEWYCLVKRRNRLKRQVENDMIIESFGVKKLVLSTQKEEVEDGNH